MADNGKKVYYLEQNVKRLWGIVNGNRSKLKSLKKLAFAMSETMHSLKEKVKIRGNYVDYKHLKAEDLIPENLVVYSQLIRYMRGDTIIGVNIGEMKRLDYERLEEVFGDGWWSDEYIDSLFLEEFSVRLSTVSVMTSPVRSSGIASLNSSIFAVGGYHDTMKSSISTHVWDSSESWKELSHLNVSRVFPIAIAAGPANNNNDKKIFVLGGELDNQGSYGGMDNTRSLVEIYDVEADKWSTESSIQVPNNKHTSELELLVPLYLFIWNNDNAKEEQPHPHGMIVIVFGEKLLLEDDDEDANKLLHLHYYDMTKYTWQFSSQFHGLCPSKNKKDTFVHDGGNKLFQICGENWLVYDLDGKNVRANVDGLGIIKHLPGVHFDLGHVSNAPQDVVCLGSPSPGGVSLFCMAWTDFRRTLYLHFAIIGVLDKGKKHGLLGELVSFGHVQLHQSYDLGRCLASSHASTVGKRNGEDDTSLKRKRSEFREMFELNV